MIKQMIITCLIIFAIIVFVMFASQRRLIYFPAINKPELQAYQADDMREISLLTEDNLHLNSWYKPAIKKHPTILYLHGNAGHIGYRMPLARQLINAGFGVLLLEYRGYGGNAGSPTEQGLYADGRAAIRFLQQQGVSLKQLVLYGESLGTGVATQLAAEQEVCAIILQSPFTSLDDLARYHYPWNLIKPWDHFDSLKRINLIHSPLLVLHGKRDSVVPYTQGLALFQQAGLPKKMVSFESSDHNNLWSNISFSPEVIHFIRAHCF